MSKDKGQTKLVLLTLLPGSERRRLCARSSCTPEFTQGACHTAVSSAPRPDPALNLPCCGEAFPSIVGIRYHCLQLSSILSETVGSCLCNPRDISTSCRVNTRSLSTANVRSGTSGVAAARGDTHGLVENVVPRP